MQKKLQDNLEGMNAAPSCVGLKIETAVTSCTFFYSQFLQHVPFPSRTMQLHNLPECFTENVL